MKVRNLRRLAGFILAVLLLPGLIALSSKSVQAQQRRVVIVRTYRPIYRPYWDPFWNPYGRFGRYNYYSQYVFRNSDEAFNEGYHDGLKTGQGDAKHRRSYDPQRSHYYQEAGFGNFGEVYRSGFLRGYADGFRS